MANNLSPVVARSSRGNPVRVDVVGVAQQGPLGAIFPDAPGDGAIYGRQGGTISAWQPVLPLAGGALTGPLTLAGNATLPLQAVPLQQLNTATAGGPFLPLAGGTVLGTITAPLFASPGDTYTGSGTPIPARLALAWNLAGTTTGAGNLATITVSSDTADGTAAANGAITGLNITQNVGAAKGGRAGIWQQLNVGALAAAGQEMVGIQANCFAFASTNTNGALLQAIAATNVARANSSVGSLCNEFDYSAETGSSVSTKIGLQITLGTADAVAGSSQDAGLMFTNANPAASSPGMSHGIQFGSLSHGWPINPTTGTIIGAVQEVAYKASARTVAFVPVTAFAGVDFLNVGFFGYAFRSAGFSVDAGGQISTGNAAISRNATGIAIDIPRQIVTAAAVAAGGGGGGIGTNDYYTGDILFDANGGQYRVATVTAGAVATVTVLVPSTAVTPPTNPVTTTGGSGTGCTLTLTWSVRNTLALNPSGGATTFGGAVTLPAGTTGPFLPLTGGIVTGATTFSSTVTISGTITGAGMTSWAASPPAIGSTAAASGAFTTLGATGAATLAGGGTFTGTFAGAHTYSGALTLSAAGTALSVTNNATTGGTHVIGSGSNNILTVAPGAAAANTIVFGQSGTGGVAMPGPFVVQLSSIQAQTTLASGTLGGTSCGLTLQSAVGNVRPINFTTGASLRWSIRTNTTAEGGSNAGSDLDIVSFTDAGAALQNPMLRITRSTGNAAFAASIGVFGVTPPARPTGWGTSTGGARAAITASSTLPQVAAGLAQLLNDLTAYGLIGV